MAKIRGGKIPWPLRKQSRATGVAEKTTERMAKMIGDSQAKSLFDRGPVADVGNGGEFRFALRC